MWCSRYDDYVSWMDGSSWEYNIIVQVHSYFMTHIQPTLQLHLYMTQQMWPSRREVCSMRWLMYAWTLNMFPGVLPHCYVSCWANECGEHIIGSWWQLRRVGTLFVHCLYCWVTESMVLILLVDVLSLYCRRVKTLLWLWMCFLSSSTAFTTSPRCLIPMHLG